MLYFKNFSLVTTLFLINISISSAGQASADKPNIIIMFADDLGYGDLGCFGHPTIRTPNLDRMAGEGMKLTQFYSAAPVCTPSRAALMTGRLPVRSGMSSNHRRVLFPDSEGGLPEEEITIGEALQKVGYRTACIGKWHLGHHQQYLPTNNGFDYYFGIPYSNDMNSVKRGDPPVPLMENLEIIEQPANQNTLTRRYTEEAIRFINQKSDQPFFIYLPYTFPHVPLFASDEFLGTSTRGLYGDVVEEIDWSVGQILEELRKKELDKNTLVVFTSDNGPWLTRKLQGGSAGLLRDGKGSTWEGGMREPSLAWWPGKIKAGSVSQEMGSTMDLFNTSLLLGGAEVPTDRIIDGVDFRPVLFSSGENNRKYMFYYRGQRLMAVRKGPWKMHIMTQNAYGQKNPVTPKSPILYHLDQDPSEMYDVAKDHPEVITEIQQLIQEHEKDLVIAKSQLEDDKPVR